MESKPGYFYVGTRSILKDENFTTSIYLSSDPNPPEKIQEEQDETQIISTPPNNFHEIQRAFFTQMHAFLDVLPAGASLVPALRSAWVEVFKKQALEKHSSNVHSYEDWEIFEVPEEFRNKINRYLNKSKRTRDALLIFPQLMLLGLVSQFDAYMGGLLRIAISKRPDIIQKSQKSFPASEVLQYSDIDAFKEAVIEKEIESFLRKSHEEQFSWLASTFDVKTTDGLASWPAFVEACERRNLFAHSNGLVSEQYRIKCLAVGAACPPNKGDKLDVTPEYLRKTIGIFLEIGIKIAQVISRKIDKSIDNIIKMDGTINSISYDLISHEHYEEASELLDFAVTTMKQHPDAEILNMMIVNNANAHKLLGDIESSKRILGKVDWSPFDSKYKISVAAVLDDIDRVIALMPQMKNRDDFGAEIYQDWPVFTSIRTNDKFLSAYEKLYGCPFTVGSVKHQDAVNAQDALDPQEAP